MSQRFKRVWPFAVWLIGFYAVWLAIVVIGRHGSLVLDHWPIAAAMVAGSYCAGSTPMGGGTVGFPILVLLFDQPADLGRDFSLAIQSIGMISATILILTTRKKLANRMLKWAILGSFIGTPLGAIFVAPYAPDLVMKLIFAVIWASFGIMTFVKIREIASVHHVTPTTPQIDRNMGLFVGIVGGVLAALTGVGIDLVMYAVLVLLVRADLKVAIPTSVVLMACTSVIGYGTNLALGSLSSDLFGHWLAAAPIVAVGAPFGAIVVDRISRVPTLIVVSALCIGQFFWTCVHEGVGVTIWIAAIGGVIFCNALFHLLYRRGGELAAKFANSSGEQDLFDNLTNSSPALASASSD